MKTVLHKIHRANSTEGSCTYEDETVRNFLLEHSRFIFQLFLLKLRLGVIDNRPFSLQKHWVLGETLFDGKGVQTLFVTFFR